MPTTYAHWRFGDKCIPTLPEDLQNIIHKYRNEFDYGVHGPDIFFYYNCLKHNEVNKYGTWMHDQPFRDTLKNTFKPMYKRHDNREAALSYLLGFLCHFTLDSYCHGYIDRKDEVSGCSHGRIESQYDRHLLIKDGFDPIKKSVTFSLKPTESCCHNIAQMYTRFDEKTVAKTLKDQLFYLNLLKDDSDIKRGLLRTAMKLAKTYSFLDLLIGKTEDERCKDSMLRLDKYFDKAREHYPALAANLVAWLDDKAELDEYFHNHFCPKPDYKEIPILSYDEELNYQVDFQK